MKVLILAPEIQHCHKLSIYTSQLKKSMEQLSIDNDLVDQITFRNSHSDSTTLSYDLKQLSDYADAAEVINSNYDVCILQYQPGVYGGKGGNYVMNLAAQLSIPLFCAFHSLTSEPSEIDKEIVCFLAERSQCVFVFSQLSVEFLEHYYKVNRDKILKTDYGVSVFNPVSVEQRNTALGVGSQKVILACGSMDRINGFETIINALPSVVKYYSDLMLVIVNTDSQNQREKEYAKSLMRLAAQRGVSDRVKLVRHDSLKVSLDVLMNAADVYVSAVVDDKRLDDALLSMAVGSGAAVLSTPTWFANELLGDKNGSFFSFKSSSELSAEIMLMLRNERETQMYRANASLYGAQTSWPVVAKRLKEILQSLSLTPTNQIKSHFNPSYLPDVNLNHLLSLWWQSGFVAQSVYGIPDLSNGYSLEDNAMVLQVLVKASEWQDREDYRVAIRKCLALIKLMKGDDGKWYNSISVRGKPTDLASETAIGRLINALGNTFAFCNDQGVKDVAYGLLLEIVTTQKLTSNKAQALGVIGLARILEYDTGNTEYFNIFKKWSEKLVKLLPNDPYIFWQWYEDEVGEQAGLIPLALANVYHITRDKEVLSVVKRSLRFLEKHSMNENRFSIRFIGLKKGENKPMVSKVYTATETYLFTEVYNRLFELTKEDKYQKPGIKCHNWYLGDNSIGKCLYDINSGGCYNSFSGRTVNPVMTLQSTCAYWLSHFSILDLYFKQLIAEVKA